jgi:hypothetical protein
VRRNWLVITTIAAVSGFSSPVFAQIAGGSIPTHDQGPFNLAEAYPCTAAPYTTGSEATSITPLQVFNGTGTNCGNAANNTTNSTPGPIPGAAPGILCLKRASDVNGNRLLTLDVNCFAVIPSNQVPPCFVQGYRLIKQVPGSFKCPDVYGLPHFDDKGNLIPYQYYQFGSGVRTWWSLNFTQPGTQFILEVVSVCRTGPIFAMGEGGSVLFDVNTGKPIILSPGGTPVLHKDRWIWRVVADTDTLATLINLMHTGAVGTLEVPCILGEDMYDALIKAQTRLANAIAETTGTRLADVGNAIFDMEALVVANCLFVELLNPLVAFPGPAQFGAPNISLPGNLAPTVSFSTQGSAVAGIIDTIEHPCCCKLLVDLEWITIRQGLAGTNPTLPTF